MPVLVQLVDDEAWSAAHALRGSIYFIRPAGMDIIKIGHSHWLSERRRTLQTAHSTQLQFIGVMAAFKQIEPIIHHTFRKIRLRGEWFIDDGSIAEWLQKVTGGNPRGRCILALENDADAANFVFDEVLRDYSWRVASETPEQARLRLMYEDIAQQDYLSRVNRGRSIW